MMNVMKKNYEFHEWNELNFVAKTANLYEFCTFVPIRTLASQILLSHSHNSCNS